MWMGTKAICAGWMGMRTGFSGDGWGMDSKFAGMDGDVDKLSSPLSSLSRNSALE